MPAITKGADLSECGRFRYSLWRALDGDVHKSVAFIMLNPSTADGLNDDPTIRRCLGFAKRMNASSLYVGNLFALRATNPLTLMKALDTKQDAVGPNNDYHLDLLARLSSTIIVAWGAWQHQAIRNRADQVLKTLTKYRDVHCLAKTTYGHPKHPLYLRGDLDPILFHAKGA